MVKQGASEGGNTNNSCFLKLHKEQMLSVLQPPIPAIPFHAKFTITSVPFMLNS